MQLEYQVFRFADFVSALPGRTSGQGGQMDHDPPFVRPGGYPGDASGTPQYPPSSSAPVLSAWRFGPEQHLSSPGVKHPHQALAAVEYGGNLAGSGFKVQFLDASPTKSPFELAREGTDED